MPRPTDLPEELAKRIERLERVLNKEPFFVLVWGSGAGSTDDFEKRQKIKDYLEHRLGDGRVMMSEDEPFRELVEKRGLAVAEALETLGVDAVVVLDTSIGPHTEITLYNQILGEKAIVFVASAHKDSEGFPAVSYDTLKVEGYSPDEFEDCTLIRRKANRFVQARLFRKAEKKLRKLSA